MVHFNSVLTIIFVNKVTSWFILYILLMFQFHPKIKGSFQEGSMFFLKSNDKELMQYLNPVGFGPSSNR